MKVKGSSKKNMSKRSMGALEKWQAYAANYAKIVTHTFLIFIMVLFPFYAPYGYVDIGMNKFYFFRMTGLVSFGLLVPAVLILVYIKLYMQIKWNKKSEIHLSFTDKTMLLYGVAVVLSFIFSGWKEEALWGTDGWYMGMISQLMFVVIYFIVSRYTKNEKKWYVVFMAVSFCIFVLGLLNRFSVYPIQMDGANPIFISTLGNINWFCSYWMVLFPVGIVLYWLGSGDTIWKKTGLILYIIIGFMTGVVQGSSSAFLALGAIIFTLFCLSFRENQKLLRWLEMLFWFAVSLLLIGVIKSSFPESLNYSNSITEKITEFSVSIVLLAVSAIGYAILNYLITQKKLEVEKIVFIRNTVVGMCAFVIILAVVLLIYYTNAPEIAGNSKLAQAFVFDRDWGNSRGTTWMAGIMAFMSMSPLEKLVGVGPDCFGNYAYSVQKIADLLYYVFGDSRLTNTHNEWLTILVNVGLFGCLTYAAAFVSAIIRQIREGKNNEIILVSAVCIISYTMHNMVSFQQVICTPVVFILLGMGEGILRRKTSKKDGKQ